MNCIYCEKEMKQNGASHQLYCKSNPDRKIVDWTKGENNGMKGKEGSNQFKKGKNEGKEILFSNEAKEKIRNSKIGKKLTIKQKENIKKAMQKAVLQYPNSYNASNVNGRTKKIEYNSIIFDSSWELIFYKWCEKEKIICEKNVKGFNYFWNGERIYFPDFYLKEYDVYVEVKGYERERDILKWSSLNNLIVIKISQINKIKNNKFNKNEFIKMFS